jgi:nickel-type superoxide dismutase maturation protease
MARPSRWLDRLPLARFVVADTSMRPALEPGDGIVVARWLPPRGGDLVVFRRPDQTLTVAVKRVEQVAPSGELMVAGDNVNVSSDSRHFGPVPPDLVVGRVVYRYRPPERRGWL